MGPKEMTSQSPADSPPVINVLCVSATDQDQRDLRRILSSAAGVAGGDWVLHVCLSLTAARSVLALHPIAVAMCDAEMPDGDWVQFLEHLTVLPDPPPLIVTSRLADERLWSVALNCGAYDVLPKPYAVSEVVRSLNSAWRHWDTRGIPADRKRLAAASATSSGVEAPIDRAIA
jgi:DNA-binding NtrC family response regulator